MNPLFKHALAYYLDAAPMSHLLTVIRTADVGSPRMRAAVLALEIRSLEGLP